MSVSALSATPAAAFGTPFGGMPWPSHIYAKDKRRASSSVDAFDYTAGTFKRRRLNGVLPEDAGYPTDCFVLADDDANEYSGSIVCKRGREDATPVPHAFSTFSARASEFLERASSRALKKPRGSPSPFNSSSELDLSSSRAISIRATWPDRLNPPLAVDVPEAAVRGGSRPAALDAYLAQRYAGLNERAVVLWRPSVARPVNERERQSGPHARIEEVFDDELVAKDTPAMGALHDHFLHRTGRLEDIDWGDSRVDGSQHSSLRYHQVAQDSREVYMDEGDG